MAQFPSRYSKLFGLYTQRKDKVLKSHNPTLSPLPPLHRNGLYSFPTCRSLVSPYLHTGSVSGSGIQVNRLPQTLHNTSGNSQNTRLFSVRRCTSNFKSVSDTPSSSHSKLSPGTLLKLSFTFTYPPHAFHHTPQPSGHTTLQFEAHCSINSSTNLPPTPYAFRPDGVCTSFPTDHHLLLTELNHLPCLYFDGINGISVRNTGDMRSYPQKTYPYNLQFYHKMNRFYFFFFISISVTVSITMASQPYPSTSSYSPLPFNTIDILLSLLCRYIFSISGNWRRSIFPGTDHINRRSTTRSTIEASATMLAGILIQNDVIIVLFRPAIRGIRRSLNNNPLPFTRINSMLYG